MKVGVAMDWGTKGAMNRSKLMNVRCVEGGFGLMYSSHAFHDRDKCKIEDLVTEFELAPSSCTSSWGRIC
jgi:hypothetical protein